MLASTVCNDDSSASETVAKKWDIEKQKVGSDSYQQNHMGLIFRDNLSFSGFERNKVFLGREGGFLDLSRVSGADSEGDCRAVLVADFDDDGDCDLFVNAIQRDCHYLFRNDLPRDASHNSIKIRLRATTGHPDAIGAIVKMKGVIGTQARVLSCGGGFASQDADEIVFGLGTAKRASFSVRWPGRRADKAAGSVAGKALEEFGVLEAGGRYLLVEGAGRPQGRESATFTFAEPSPRGVKARPHDRLSSLDLLRLDGTEQKVAVTADRRVLLNFWSTSCTSCLNEMPELVRLHTEKKYHVIAVSLDPPERRAVIEDYVNRLGIKFDVFRIGDRQAGELFDLSRLAIPVTFVISKDGDIERILQGRIKKGDL